MNKMIKQIMNNEGCNYEDAKEIYSEMREELFAAVEDGDYTLAEDVMLSYGFEMDYFIDMI